MYSRNLNIMKQHIFLMLQDENENDYKNYYYRF